MNYPKFLIHRDEHGHYYFRLFSERNTELLKGFPCRDRRQCIETIRELYDTIRQDHHYRFRTRNGQFYFEVTGATHNVIAESTCYRTMGGLAFGKDALKRKVRVALIEDHHPSRVAISRDHQQ